MVPSSVTPRLVELMRIELEPAMAGAVMLTTISFPNPTLVVEIKEVLNPPMVTMGASSRTRYCPKIVITEVDPTTTDAGTTSSTLPASGICEIELANRTF
jgi:hypothetical protein